MPGILKGFMDSGFGYCSKGMKFLGKKPGEVTISGKLKGKKEEGDPAS
jgi:multimeric flavodoxin WrbA